MPIDFVDIKDVNVGAESESEEAIHVQIEGEWHWIPLSQVERITRDKRMQNSDIIRVAKWLADKLEFEY